VDAAFRSPSRARAEDEWHGHLPGSTRPLSAAGGTGPAQVGFSSDGGTLLVTEKATNTLMSWRVNMRSGLLGAPTVTPSAGVTPFGFAFDNRDRAFVSEAVGGAALASTTSSYRFTEQQPERAMLVSASVPNLQTAACWVAVTPNGKFAYTGNAGSSSISLSQVGRDGSLTLGEAAAGVTGSGTGVTDLAVSRSGQALYALAPGATRVVAFEVGADGRLAPSSTLTGLPGMMVGIAANERSGVCAQAGGRCPSWPRPSLARSVSAVSRPWATLRTACGLLSPLSASRTQTPATPTISRKLSSRFVLLRMRTPVAGTMWARKVGAGWRSICSLKARPDAAACSAVSSVTSATS
jgi:hypothetical protein